ncbi:MAG: hypothetical protein H7Y59_04530 [Anaerolineales bacterium]|nr:hypothetical protein [Anaerolineales bacterium]
MFEERIVCAAYLEVHDTRTVIFGGQAVLRGRWETARYLMPMLTYSSTMLTIVTLVHIDKFIPGLKLNSWLASYILAPIALNWFYWWHQKNGGTWIITGHAVLPATRLLALTLGGLMLTFSLVALLFPTLFIASAPWPMSPLIIRAFASIWGAFSMGPLWFAREKDWNRLYPVADMLTLMPIFWLLIIAFYPHDPAITIADVLPLLILLGIVLIGGIALRGLQMKK